MVLCAWHASAAGSSRAHAHPRPCRTAHVDASRGDASGHGRGAPRAWFQVCRSWLHWHSDSRGVITRGFEGPGAIASLPRPQSRKRTAPLGAQCERENAPRARKRPSPCNCSSLIGCGGPAHVLMGVALPCQHQAHRARACNRRSSTRAAMRHAGQLEAARRRCVPWP